jgi:CDP-glucose 4,6-dehydratase
MHLNPAFWQNKTVFLTGHTGFKGSWLSLWLTQLGARVVGYSNEVPTTPSLFHLTDMERDLHSIYGDIRDLNCLQRAMLEAQPDIVIHMAAQPLVRRSYQQPVETFATNVMGTVHVLEAVRHCPNIRVLLNVTTDKCYENQEQGRDYQEEDPMGGFDPYSSSKGCAELVTAAYRRSYFQEENGLCVASARAGNVIGGGDWAEDRLIPDIMKAFLAQKPVSIRNPQAIRPWQHVLEPLGGYLLLVESLWLNGQGFAEGWNFGPNPADIKPVGWVVETLAQYWGDAAQWSLVESAIQPHEATLLSLNCQKAAKRLRWQPRLTLDETLNWVVSWYKAYQQGRLMRELCLGQIERYQQLMKSTLTEVAG